MKKKILKLEELKVKSFVTQVNKAEQKTAKGGYVYKPGLPIAMSEVGVANWTSEKTRVLSSDNLLSGLRGKG